MTGKDVRNIGGRLELFVDDWLVDELKEHAQQRLHEPVPQNVALVTDSSWEGNMGGYITAFKDGDVYRMYYQSRHVNIVKENAKKNRETFRPLRVAYAESTNGIHWEKPNTGIYEIDGSKNNNVVWEGVGPARIGTHGFTAFRDANPDAKREGTYKALGTTHDKGAERGLYGMQSADGIHWELISGEPFMTKGKFDSQNLAFWDSVREEYRCYLRDFHPGKLPDDSLADNRRSGIRDIRTCTSKDFIHWTNPVMLTYTGAPEEALYTNQIGPYYRAPHLVFGFPSRYVERPWSKAVELLPELNARRDRSAVSVRYGTVVTDGLFITSRDRQVFYKWPDVFLRPGPQLEGNWVYGDNYQCYGLFETQSSLPGAPMELSFVAPEHYWRGDYTIFRRYSIRIDGFVSVHASILGGEMLTKPLTFSGDDLYINFSSSAAGRIQVEIQDHEGKPVPGFRLDDCIQSIGDELDRKVYWKDDRKPGVLAGQTVRLRFVIHDADLYAIQFR